MPVSPGLIFSAEEIIYKKSGFGFDDITLVPQYSEITNLNPPSLKTKITKNYHQDIPIMSANMDTVTEFSMAQALMKIGGSGVIHRFLKIEEQVRIINELSFYKKQSKSTNPIIASVGVHENEKMRAEKLLEAGCEILCLDIAHGDSAKLYQFLDYLKKTYPNTDVIAGNVTSADGVRRMIEHGADAVKVGVGTGSLSDTQSYTGHGVPSITGIALANNIAGKYDVPIIADGGIRNNGDVVKALSAGASVVMIGSLIAGTDEAAGKENHMKQKIYRGVSYHDTVESWIGEKVELKGLESKQMLVSNRGPVENIIADICSGLKMAMGFVGALEVQQMAQKALFMQVRSNNKT